MHQYMISRGRPIVIGNATIRVEDYEGPDGRINARKLLEEGMVEAWQRIRDLSLKGRHTYTFFQTRFQTECWMVRVITHNADGYEPWCVHGETIQTGTERGPSLQLPLRGAWDSGTGALRVHQIKYYSSTPGKWLVEGPHSWSSGCGEDATKTSRRS